MNRGIETVTNLVLFRVWQYFEKKISRHDGETRNHLPQRLLTTEIVSGIKLPWITKQHGETNIDKDGVDVVICSLDTSH